jgi:hypothetical protein
VFPFLKGYKYFQKKIMQEDDEYLPPSDLDLESSPDMKDRKSNASARTTERLHENPVTEMVRARIEDHNMIEPAR